MKHAPLNRMQTAVRLSLLFAMVVCVSFEMQAQEIGTGQMPAPPPMRFVPRDDRARLSEARDAKTRIRLSIELAEARLLRAEQLSAGRQFDMAASELGIYQGLIEDSLRFLNEQRTDRNRLRDIYKRLDLVLRAHGARIEAIRRTTPAEHAINVKAVSDYTRDARADALNGFYGDTVIRDDADENAKSSENGKSADTGKDSAKQPR